MTVEEISREFDLLYRNANKSAPNLDEYEKSVYLTHAQLEIVKNYFTPLGNKYRRGFEQSSKRRNDLNTLVRPFSTTERLTEDDDYKISRDSQLFTLPEDVFLIVHEHVYSLDDKLCRRKDSNGELIPTEINVRPITHDEFNTLKNNPFKQPDDEIVWRLDYGEDIPTGTIKVVELISPYEIESYNFRYVKYPDPIILTNLDEEFPGEDLSIEGRDQKQTCKLNKSIHSEIIKRAVELAENDYFGGNLQSRIHINQRNE